MWEVSRNYSREDVEGGVYLGEESGSLGERSQAVCRWTVILSRILLGRWDVLKRFVAIESTRRDVQ